MLELWGMRSTHLLPLLPGPLWLGVVPPDSPMGQIERNSVLMLNWIVWNRTVFDIENVYVRKTELLEIELFSCAKLKCLK